MKIVCASFLIITLILFGAYKNTADKTDNGFEKNVKFNHLCVVLDDSTYNYLLDSLKLPRNFAKTTEEATSGWSGKYVYGRSNYLEFFKSGSIAGSEFGDLGLGFMSNKLGTIDIVQDFWTKTRDSVHIENKTITDNGITTPWFKSVSISSVGSMKVKAWIFENSKEEMHYAGFDDADLLRPIEYTEYIRHLSAKLRNIPLDSVKSDKVFDKVTSIKISLSAKELLYLKAFLTDIGFKQKKGTFSKDGFRILYSITASEHFVLKEIGFSLSKKMPREKHAFRKIEMLVDGEKAIMKFRY